MAQWTIEQKAAIDARDCNLLVNAAAGSGKTAVLVERILQKVIDEKENIDIDTLLVVTFTNAAAAEMRERIGKALIDKINQEPNNLHLKKQMMLINHADITTIDAFCLNVVRNNFHLLDIDPDFSIVGANETLLWQDEVINELFDELYEIEDSDFLKLSQIYSANRNDYALKQLILQIHKFTSSLAYPNKWLDEKANMFFVCDNIWFDNILARVKVFIDECIEKYNEAIDYMNKAISPESEEDELTQLSKKWGKYWEHINNELFSLKQIKNHADLGWSEVYKSISEFTFARASGGKASEEERAPIKEARDEVKAIVEKRIRAVVNDTRENIKEVLKKEIHPIVCEFVRLVKMFDERFTQKKVERGVLDFSDVEHLCLSLLTNDNGELSDVALELRDKYSEILIDEYQDSNELQEAIFTKISNGNNMFMVGDMKQSIYRFRNTDPTLFKNKNNTFSLNEDEINRKIILAKNFRSNASVLDSVNVIFENIMSEYIGEITYNEEHKLNVGIEGTDNKDTKSELCVINTDKEGILKDIELKYIELKDVQIEAIWIAKRIKELKDSKYLVFDKNKNDYRPIENKDIVILLRSVKANGEKYADALNSVGIDAFAESNEYFSKNEVRVILSLIKVINNPKQDIPLIGVMRSVIGNFSDDDLVQIHNNTCQTMYDALIRYVEEEENELSTKCKRFLEDIKKWRSYAKFMSSDKLIWTLYNETNYYTFVGALNGGEEKQANLRLLFERAKNFENSGFKGLFNFISMLEKMIENESEMSPAKMLSENHNVVKIMSIHKSKGLEFPVTIIGGMGRRFYKTVPNDRVVLHKDLGFGMEYVNANVGYTYPTITKHAICNQAELENLSEEMRMLYVAMTRAKQKLIVVGTTKSIDKDIKKWDRVADDIKDSYVLSAGNFLNWVAPIAKKSEYWNFNIVSLIDVLTEKEPVENVIIEKNDKNDDVNIGEVFSYKYPFEQAKKLPSKISVTEIKRRNEHNNDEDATIISTKLIEKPQFMQEGHIMGAQAGVALHYVMQNINLKEDMSESYIISEMDKMMETGELSKEELNSVNPKKIYEFFKSEIGNRLLNAKKIYREIPFEIGISACGIDKSLNKDYEKETIILQGMIDCYFEEDDGIVLIDYKSDFYKDKQDILNRYKIQINYYARAIEEISKKIVKNKIIYLFHGNDVIYYM